MLLLMAFLERPTDKKSLQTYQRDQWGRLSSGETCVIELSGLPANSFKVPRDRELFRRERIEVIRQRLRTYKPALVVMYGLSEKKHWQEIAGGAFPPDNLRRVQSTSFAFTRHPISFGLKNGYWVEWGEKLREVANRSQGRP
jgi:hypothetical protein